MKNRAFYSLLFILFSLLLFSSCREDEPINNLEPAEDEFGKANDTFSADEWYPGGQRGTTLAKSYSAFAPAVEDIADGVARFKHGEDFFEHLYTFNDEPRKGLGPVWVRSSCIHCHPSYGHGKRMDRYRANDFGNGYLLVIYHPDNNAYISEVTGMPQTAAMTPFKAPIDETLINIQWKNVTSMPSGLKMEFPADGEKIALIYPEVTIPQYAFHTNPLPDNYEVRLESTIGIYGTGLLDAITDEDMRDQHRAEAPYVALNPAMWDVETNDFKPSAYYSAPYNDLGTFRGTHGPVKRFTYAMTRGSLQDGAGANAIWNITNVTRSDRHWLYSTPAWAKAQSEDPEVIDYIQQHGSDKSSLLYPYYADGTPEGIAVRINDILSVTSIAKKETFDKYFYFSAPYAGKDEMSDEDYYDFMVWHRGLAVPAARDLDKPAVKRGKQLFNKIGCAACHRASWTTGKDDMWVDASTKAYAESKGIDPAKALPKYAEQTIWPYTDMVQHRLYMINDIRTGWCRTTPLWGRGLSLRLTGAEDRLHDCRARNEIEAIMWHAYSSESDAYDSALQFYNLSKEDRDAIVLFLRAI
ncbi:MAG: hypothetical protein IK011_05740 [Bacteroidaceae bacterium]|nr:hypothetical protein [Bacteroidaceae bacterium]